MMTKILYGGVLVLLVLTGILFAVLNAEPVKLNYYFGSLEMPLSLAIMLALVLGAVLGVVASIGLIFRGKKEVSRLRKATEMAEKEVSNLRAIPIKNKH